ncbi:MAG: class I poly(R)-hydroxyalkanoic acid synthase [Pseudomonadota bacterium]
MTTKESAKDEPDAPNLDKLTENLEHVETLSKRLVEALSHKRQIPASLQGPNQELFAKAATAYVQEMMQNPAKIVEHQIDYWKQTVTHYVEAQQTLAKGKLEAPEDHTPRDRRFKNPLWDSHPYFNFLKQQYMMNAAAVDQAIADIEGLNGEERKRVEYFSRQIVDLFAPTNFLATNPDALERAVATDGQSLVDGLENLVADIEANHGEVQVNLADKAAFTVGKNIATTPGEVIFRNRLFELIQYTPTTDQVHQTPLILFPPWINKFYILDLKEQNSLIKWIVDQGFTLFVVSWVNPDASYRDTSLDDYVEEGYLTAIREVQQICAVKKVNVIGYCIAGTTLSLTMALLNKRGEDPIKSATLFTTLTDFSDTGEVGVFLDDDFVDGIEEQVGKDGYLSSFFMSRTFSYLRSNDLIYQPAIKSYMMGEAPPAFDLLYWNGDGTNLPAKMAVQYLRGLCQRDEFAQGGFPICGETVTLSDVKTPICAIACETDHIAAWDNSYHGVQQMSSRDKTFVLSQSGHIAGIVNPPSKNKYGHYVNEDLSLSAEDWKDSADFVEGSWWPRWGKWLAGRSGKKVKARTPGDSTHPTLSPAPGTYVSATPND